MKKVFVLVCCFASFCIMPGFAQNIFTQKKILDNGLTVLVSEMPSSSMVSVFGLVKTGSATEGQYLGAGLTHFMEHMLFKGTDRRGVGQIPQEIQSLGGTINASTNFDYTIYTITVPNEHFEAAVDILSDMLMHARFDAAELEKERDVVFNEMRLYQNRPDRYLSRKVLETVYTTHPYRVPVIGYEDLLRPLTREDFLNYYHQRYVPNNMIIAVAGGIAPENAFSMAEKFFSKYPRASETLRSFPQEPAQIDARYDEEYFSTELVQMSVSYQGVGIRDEDVVALDALAMILGDGKSSRLYKTLHDDQKLVYSINASNFTPMDQGLFEIEVSSAEDHVDKILAGIDHEIRYLIDHGVSEEELEKVVNSSLKSLFLEDQTSSGVAYRMAIDTALTGKTDFTQWYVKAFERLSPSDIVRTAKKYLRADRRSVVVLKPKAMMPAEEIISNQAMKNEPIERVVLDNGLVVLLREDHRSPLIWINLVVDGGVYKDPGSLSGLSNMVAGMWPKGSRRYSKEMINALTDQKGMSLSSFSGNQSFGLQMDMLSRDQKFGMELFFETVLNPLFLEAQLQDEKRLVITAIQAQNDSIESVGSIALHRRLFDGHPLAKTQLGVAEEVQKMTRRDLLGFYHDQVIPSRAVLSVFGDFQKDDLLKQVKQLLGSWHGDLKGTPDDHPLKKVAERVEETVRLDKDQAMVMYGFQAESFYHEDRYGLELLGALIGSPFQGRMFTQLRDEKGLAYTLGGGYSPAKDTGELNFRILTSPATVTRVKEGMEQIVEDIQEKGVTTEELGQMKQYLIGRFERAIETSGSLSFSTALDELYGIGYEDHLHYQERIQNVSAEQIRQLAIRYLDLNNAVVVTVLPEGE